MRWRLWCLVAAALWTGGWWVHDVLAARSPCERLQATIQEHPYDVEAAIADAREIRYDIDDDPDLAQAVDDVIVGWDLDDAPLAIDGGYRIDAICGFD